MKAGSLTRKWDTVPAGGDAASVPLAQLISHRTTALSGLRACWLEHTTGCPVCHPFMAAHLPEQLASKQARSASPGLSWGLVPASQGTLACWCGMDWWPREQDAVGSGTLFTIPSSPGGQGQVSEEPRPPSSLCPFPAVGCGPGLPLSESQFLGLQNGCSNEPA